MAQVDLDIAYNVRLTGAEFRLVTLALAGRIASEEETRDALSLNERLCQLRARLIAELGDVTAGAYRSASALRTSAHGASVDSQK